MRGLRQGDPLSPYLFLITADVLQRLIRCDDVLQHPIVDGAPCPVLQYADDTLIILRAEVGAARRLRRLLHQFERSTGLCINYSKSTIVPMHVAPDVLAGIKDELQCRVEGFPQTYLGLPLSAEKLRLAAFAPLISKADKYLSGWSALLLSSGGRLVLLNAVLDALPTFAMGAMELPLGVVAALDRLRRAFLWAGSDRVSGAQCLVAWDLVCRPKEEGGLGVRSLPEQNACLQIELLHRLHVAPGASWPRWVWDVIGDAPLDSLGRSALICGTHWASLLRLLPLYRSISRVEIGDGARTAFWWDAWTPSGPLAAAMPELLSHCTAPGATVRQMMATGLDNNLVPRLSATAAAQKDALHHLLRGVQLCAAPDRRSLPLCGKGAGGLRTSTLYKLCVFGSMKDTNFAFVWQNRAPSRVRFFAWLLVRGRIQCRANLHRKNILDLSASGCPLCPAPLETAAHIMFGCPFAQRFWAAMGARPAPELPVADAAHCALPPTAPTDTAATLRLLCLWHL